MLSGLKMPPRGASKAEIAQLVTAGLRSAVRRFNHAPLPRRCRQGALVR